MTTLTTSKVAAGVQPKVVENGVVSVKGTYNVTAALALNDVIQMVKVPEGATVLGARLSCDDLDTHTAPAIVICVGDGADTDRYVPNHTVGQAGGMVSLNSHAGLGYTYTADDTVDVLVSTGPGTGATTGSITLVIDYTMDP